MNQLFGTNGIRGVIGETMTPDLALRMGKAIGTWLKAGDTVAIGTDARESRDMLQGALAAGIQSTGVNTLGLGILASPGIQLYVRDQGVAAGAIITASHNPPVFNGIKLVAPDGTETSPDEEGEVEAIYFSKKFRVAAWDAVGTHSSDDTAAQRYVDSVIKQVDAEAIRKAGMKVVLDCGGGAGCVATPMLLDALGVGIVPISCELDGAFSDRPSEPTPANSAACIAAVKEHGANLGFLHDGDADRAIFIDETGGYIWGDTSLAMACLHELKRHQQEGILPKVCTAVSSSSCVADAVKMGGGELHWTVVGSPIVAREMLRLGAVFGGEDNGGLMFTRHQVCRDGLMALGFYLELLATTGRTLSDLAAEIPRYSLVKDKVAVPDAQKAAIVAQLREAGPAQPGVKEVDARDGVKLYTDDGWVLVRPSGTEPIYRVQAEAKTEARAQELVDHFKALLTELINVAA